MGQSPDGIVTDDENDDASSTPPGGAVSEESTDNEGKDPRVKELSDEAARRRIENKELKTQLDTAMQQLKAIEDKDKTEVEKATARVAELEAKQAEMENELQQERIQNAFLASNKYTWHNPERALALVDLNDVKINDDGKVDGLDKALEKLAKSDPYLIKSSDDGGTPPAGASGTPAGSGSKGGKGADRDALLKKYPALRR
jgi:chromosome segregation ATPase